MRNIEDTAQITIAYPAYVQMKKIIEAIETKEGVIKVDAYGGASKYYWFQESNNVIMDLIRERDEYRDKLMKLEGKK